MATELQQHAEGNDGEREEIHEGLVHKELGFNVHPDRQEAIYKKLDGEFLHFPSEERLARRESSAISGAGMVGVFGGNFTKIPSEPADLQTVLQSIDAAIKQSELQLQFNDNGINPGDIKSPREPFSQFTSGDELGNHEIVGYSQVGEDLLPAFGADWNGGASWNFTGGKATHADGATEPLVLTGTPAANLRPNRWYRFTYEIAGDSPSDPTEATAVLTTGFVIGNENIPLNLQPGTSATIYIKSIDDPEFKIEASGGEFIIESLELIEVIGGDVHVHGKITGGGNRGITVDGEGNGKLDGKLTLGSSITITGQTIPSTNSQSIPLEIQCEDASCGKIVIVDVTPFSSIIFLKIKTSRLGANSAISISVDANSSLQNISFTHRIMSRIDTGALTGRSFSMSLTCIAPASNGQGSPIQGQVIRSFISFPLNIRWKLEDYEI